MAENTSSTFADIRSGIDIYMLVPTVALFLIGVAAIYSAGFSADGRVSPYAIKQFMWGMVSFAVYVAVLKVGYKKIFSITVPLFAITIIMFILLLFIGHTTKGSQSWFNLGFMRVQPSEIGKIAFALALAQICTKVPPFESRGIGIVLLFSGVFIGLIMLQPDLGSALVYSVMMFAVLVAAGSPAKFLYGLVGAGAAMLPVGWLILKPYQRMRLMVFIDPSVDPQGAGYNVIQSRIAVGSGGILGKGFLKGTQAKLHFLPEPHTDFIFGVFSEEFGFIGCAVVLVLFALLLWRIIDTARETRDPEARLLSVAIAAWLWFQMTESVAMCMGLAPITGLPLPLFSYGGSSLLAIMIGLALVQSIAVVYKKEKF